ncbi:hypothetical protein Scep_005933 [Stephania cephalantha]|uniref:Uncharacterized protein n=1 Tax=Stephania cephalantha TaxID=152367 RepID=A0AAP0KYM4_9MAGN
MCWRRPIAAMARRCKRLTQPIGARERTSGGKWSSGQRAMAPRGRERKGKKIAAEAAKHRDGGNDGSDGAATGRIGGDEPAATRRNARNSPATGEWRRMASATDERRRGRNAMNGAWRVVDRSDARFRRNRDDAMEVRFISPNFKCDLNDLK